MKRIKRFIGLMAGKSRTLRDALSENDPNFVHQEAERELVRMRNYARGIGIGPNDWYYPDIWYVLGQPPEYE